MEGTKKILFCATVDRHIKAFHIPYINYLRSKGNIVHVASAGNADIGCDAKFNVCFNRSPYSADNIKAYLQIKRLINENNYDLIHFHTPVSSFFGRMAAKSARKNGTKIIYTAHGFHFYDGAPLKNKLIYFNMEKLVAKYTDVVITINEEDYINAREKLKIEYVEKVDGVGVDLNKFRQAHTYEKNAARKKYGFSEKDFLLIYAGEFTANKNHVFLIDVMKALKTEMPNIRLLIPGNGILEPYLKRLVAAAGLQNNITFPGFINNLNEIIPFCDVGVSSSAREGLPINVIEYLACGLPAVVTDIRGHRDIIKEGENGFLYPLNNRAEFIKIIRGLYLSNAPHFMPSACRKSVERFSLEKALAAHAKIYDRHLYCK